MKKKLLTILGLTMITVCVTACGSNNAEQTDEAIQVTQSAEVTDSEDTTIDDSAVARIKTYEFETFDGLTVVINEDNIISQEACEEPLEWDGLPADAEQIAPGRDYIIFENAENYYVEDAENKIVTVAFKELGDVIEETDFATFDNNVFSFSYNPEYFTVYEDEESVTVSFYNEKIQTAGSNIISFTKVENSDAMQVVKSYMESYGASEDEMVENYLGGDDVKGYSYSTGIVGADNSELRTCDSYYTVPSGDDVIVINELRTYGTDMEFENSIDAMFGELILTFKLDS